MAEDGHRTTRIASIAPVARPERAALGCATLAAASFMVVFAVLCSGHHVVDYAISAPGLTLAAAILALIPAVPYLSIILWIDRNEPEPLWLVAGALLWGGVTATGVSLFFNNVFGGLLLWGTGDPIAAAQLTASISAPLVEESSKGFALVWLYLLFRRHFDSVLDGLVYGALIGLGFAVVENWLYYVQAESLGMALGLWMIRGLITGAGTHMCFTALSGAGMGMFRVLRSGVARWLLPPLGLMFAMGAHFSWNTFAGYIVQQIPSEFELVQVMVGLPLAVLLLQAPFLCLVFLMVGVASAHERRIVRRYLSDERAPCVNEGELPELLSRVFLFTFFFKSGPLAWWARRQRILLQVRLAFEKWHMDREADLGSSDARDHALTVRELRRRLGRTT